MVIAQEWQHGGRLQQLDAGKVYDLPDAVAQQFLMLGAAIVPDEDRGLMPPETKPVAAPEIKRSRKDSS